MSRKIISCDGDSCWSLNVDENRWNLLTKIPTHRLQHSELSFSAGVVHNEKILLLRDQDFIALNSVTNDWRSLPKFDATLGAGFCLVNIKKYLLVFGGTRNSKSVVQFDFESQIWTTLVTSQAPFDIVYSGCSQGPILESSFLAVPLCFVKILQNFIRQGVME